MAGPGSRSRDYNQLLAQEIREANEGTQEEVDMRTKYIKEHLDSMSDEQLTRFEFFTRSHFSRSQIKSILAKELSIATENAVNDEMAIVVSSLTKLFVGELLETAITVAKEQEWSSKEHMELNIDQGQYAGLPRSCDEDHFPREAVKPEHIEEAYRRLQREGKVGCFADKSFMLSANSMVTTEVSDMFDSTAMSMLCGDIS